MKSSTFKPKGTTVTEKLSRVRRICKYRELSTCILKGYHVIWFSFSWCFLASSSAHPRDKLFFKLRSKENRKSRSVSALQNMTATRTARNKRFNEQNNSCLGAL